MSGSCSHGPQFFLAYSGKGVDIPMHKMRSKVAEPSKYLVSECVGTFESQQIRTSVFYPNCVFSETVQQQKTTLDFK